MCGTAFLLAVVSTYVGRKYLSWVRVQARIKRAGEPALEEELTDIWLPGPMSAPQSAAAIAMATIGDAC